MAVAADYLIDVREIAEPLAGEVLAA